MNTEDRPLVVCDIVQSWGPVSGGVKRYILGSTGVFYPRDSRDAAFRELGIPSQIRLLLHVGRFAGGGSRRRFPFAAPSIG